MKKNKTAIDCLAFIVMDNKIDPGKLIRLRSFLGKVRVQDMLANPITTITEGMKTRLIDSGVVELMDQLNEIYIFHGFFKPEIIE